MAKYSYELKKKIATASLNGEGEYFILRLYLYSQ